MRLLNLLLIIAAAGMGIAGTGSSQAAEPPVIPVGYDAYRQWDKWPYQRIGARAYMRSTYDRRGNNESADASHFLYQLREDFNVTLDVEGTGMLYFARYNHWHGSPWHYEVDGQDYIVKETTTANPLMPLNDAIFLPEHAFPSPLTATYATTKGADLSWVPIGFEDRFRMAYSRTFYGTGYYIYHLYMPGAKLSQPIQSWSLESTPPEDVLGLFRSAGTDIAPQPDSEAGDRLGIVEEQRTVEVPAETTQTLARLDGSLTVRALKLSIPRDQAVDFGHSRLRITWDDREAPSVDAPIALFFGTGTLYNRDDKEFLVKALPVNVRFADERVELACYFPMPFFESAKIELVNGTARDFEDVRFSVRTQPYIDPPEHVGYFHATYMDHKEPRPGHDLVFLDTNAVEGGGPWSGNFVGTSFIFSDRGELRTLEGDPRFFFDDSQTPQAYGTGTEEWGGGGDYWGGRTMTLPLAGHPVGVPRSERTEGEPLTAKEENIESAYRYLLADLMPFGRRAVIRLEHGAVNDMQEHYQSVSYWYGAPRATLVLTDTLDVGDAESESAHAYHSPDASEPYKIMSRYEWGPDHIQLDAESPQADPDDYAEFHFDAEAETPYYIWVRGRSSGGNRSDATWFQFDDAIGTARRSASGEKGFGNWRDRAEADEWSWSSELPQDPPVTIKFDTTGRHTLRVQPRDGGHEIDRIWLSTTQGERPAADFLPKTSADENHGEIVLTAQDALKLAGGVEWAGDDNRRWLAFGPKGGASLMEIFPPHTKDGRTTTTASEFTLKLEPDNWGVLLRRTLDYQFPNQRARVFVADGQSDGPEWQEAGIWYLAGSNTCYYSYPHEAGELGASNPVVQTSNRRFRDDEFLVPRELTRGRESIRVRVEFTPVKIPLLPGRKLGELAWSEIGYQAYCYVLP